MIYRNNEIKCSDEREKIDVAAIRVRCESIEFDDLFSSLPTETIETLKGLIIGDIPALLDALEAETARADVADRDIKLIVERFEEMYSEVKAERDQRDVRAVALERAIKSYDDDCVPICYTCVHCYMYHPGRTVGEATECNACDDKHHRNWQFDQSRFAGGA